MREIKNLPSGLGQPKKGEQTAELRFVNAKGETEVWLISIEIAEEVTKVWKAYIDDSVDSRLGLQRMSIERLQRHVQLHHDRDGIVQALECPHWEA